MVALLFWIVVGIVVLVAAAHESLDLFTKALTAATTAGVGIAVWRTTSIFQRETIANAEKKLKLDLLDKRFPVWAKFKELRSAIETAGDVSPADVIALRDLSREAEMLFADGRLTEALRDYAKLADAAAGRPVRLMAGIMTLPVSTFERQMAFARMERQWKPIAKLLRDAINTLTHRLTPRFSLHGQVTASLNIRW